MPNVRVLLTNPIHPEAQARLAKLVELVVAPDTQADTLKALAADCDAMVVRSHLPQDVFEGASRMKYVVRHGVGLDMVPMAAATSRGIVVANLPGSNTQAVVEYVVAAMFALRRNVVGINEVFRLHGWNAAKPMSNDCAELGGDVLGVVGYGSIGRRLSAVAHVLGMRVITHTRRPETVESPVTAVDLAELMRLSDVIVLACPHTEQTHHLINASVLEHVKSSAVLINVARGPVVDTPALVDALNQGRLGGAALDVHENGPLTGEEDIFKCPNVLLTPHLAGNTATALSQMSQWAVDTLLALLAGERPDNVVNAEVFG
ncbi:MAG: hydroxyacid dehydrogenase [Burkholderiaceae bacterium]|nr:hydroxyacid dehydrogenase [Burkholderiaceae bacterium]MCD8517399.1 hydroxyacid dehydrogenase [Burkholderiaceae bacterium]MCD8536209.1 hydroxyacid dehydrogenase [Burkholderiaceae bacterium]MCD8564987.1 hydroxyacid dehydrogenase [Burkholderiaceae bacterium]